MAGDHGGYRVLEGSKPGPWCPAYNRHRNRGICSEKRCRYYQNHRVSPVTAEGNAGEAFDESLNARSIKVPKVWFGKEFFEEFEECEWHCVRYDKPSKYVTLPWEGID